MTGVRLAAFLEKVEAFRENLDRLVSRGLPASAVKIALRNEIRDKGSLLDDGRLGAHRRAARAAGYQDVQRRPRRRARHRSGPLLEPARRRRPRVALDWDLVTSAEYRALAQQPAAATKPSPPTVSSCSKAKTSSIQDTLDEALEKLYGGAKKGLSIQRYKGLGEMNPTQLWETTMDPRSAGLLRSRSRTTSKPTSIFTVLMGDPVEPRREFIEDNALDVRNLDV